MLSLRSILRVALLSPLWGFAVAPFRPTAYAVGYILLPLRGFFLSGELLLRHLLFSAGR